MSLRPPKKHLKKRIVYKLIRKQWLPTEDLPIGQKLTAASTLFSQDKKANGKCVKALQALCSL